jgi:hypothetical protein
LTTPNPLTRESTICKVIEPLSVKFIVDFANGIDVVRDHVRTQKNRTGLFPRMYDGFTGQGVRRQAEVNAHILDTVEGALTWLTELTESLTLSNQVIIQLRDRVDVIAQNVTVLADYSVQTRQHIERLAMAFQIRVDALTQRVDRIELEQHATRQIGVVMSKWAAGRFGGFSPAASCYLAMEELRWGAFGDYCKMYNDKTRMDILTELANRAIIQLAADLRASAQERHVMTSWLQPPHELRQPEDAGDALTYLGDWSRQTEHPFVFAITQPVSHPPLALPKRCDAQRISYGIAAEIFGDEA